MRQLAVRNQVLAIEVVDSHEVQFADVGDLLIRDRRRLRTLRDLSDDCAARERMDAATAAQRNGSGSRCAGRGGAHPVAYRQRLGA